MENNNEKRTRWTKENKVSPLVLSLILIIVGLAAVIFYLQYRQDRMKDMLKIPCDPSSLTAQEAAQKFQDVYQILDDNYYEELSDADKINAMAIGLVNSMDSRYTRYFDEQENKAWNRAQKDYVGIGVTVTRHEQGFVVVKVNKNGPAEAAGVQAEDIIIGVDDEDISHFEDISALVDLILGEEDSMVALKIYRPSLQEEMILTIARAKIETENIRWQEINEQIGYIQIQEFSEHVADNFIAAVSALNERKIKNIIIDLRNNSGGWADESRKMCEAILDKDQLIATIKGRENGRNYEREWRSKKASDFLSGMQFVILTNKNTASASELFSGCLRDQGYAYIIGEQTYGKGSGTANFNLADGTGLNVTTFIYILPNGDSIEGVGLAPDQVVELKDSSVLADDETLNVQRDEQLKAALDYFS